MRRCLLLGILKAVSAFFCLYIYLFTLERFVRLLLLLLVIWLVELKLRFYDKIIISIYFFISRAKWKRRCLVLGALKISIAAYIFLLLLLLPLISVKFTQMSILCISPILEICIKCSFFCSSKIFFANLDNHRKYIKSKIHIYTKGWKRHLF